LCSYVLQYIKQNQLFSAININKKIRVKIKNIKYKKYVKIYKNINNIYKNYKNYKK